jgi:hypothetical protein
MVLSYLMHTWKSWQISKKQENFVQIKSMVTYRSSNKQTCILIQRALFIHFEIFLWFPSLVCNWFGSLLQSEINPTNFILSIWNKPNTHKCLQVQQDSALCSQHLCRWLNSHYIHKQLEKSIQSVTGSAYAPINSTPQAYSEVAWYSILSSCHCQLQKYFDILKTAKTCETDLQVLKSGTTPQYALKSSATGFRLQKTENHHLAEYLPQPQRFGAAPISANIFIFCWNSLCSLWFLTFTNRDFISKIQ